MQRKLAICREHALGAALLLLPAILAAQAPGVAPQDTAQNPQAVSLTAVFPVFAVSMNFQGSLVDGAVVPSKSANSGVDSTIQQAWDTLKTGGFNTILFKVDLNDPQAAARTANLCIWAKANSASLIPVLANASSSSAASFPTTVISLLRGGDGQQFAAYTQVSYFQLESLINSPLPKTNLAEKQKQLLDAIDSLRNAELQALTGTGVQPTPIMVNASFDYELIQQGAIVGVPLDAAAEQKAVAALKRSLLPFAGAANVNAVMVSWFPRSITSGDEGHFVSLLREVETALPDKDKKVFLDTGFSTAFNSGDQQNQFMTIALTNLAGLRATEGADGRFFGVDVSQALSDSVAEAQAPAGSSDPSQWNWTEKARQLAQMWSQGGTSADLANWLAKVRAGRALLTTQASGAGFIASPGLQAVQQFSATVAQVSQNMTPATISSTGQTAQTPPSPDTTTSPAAMPAGGASASPTGAPPAGPSTPSAYSQMLQSLVQQVTTQLTTAMVTKLTTPKQSQYPAYAAQNGAQAFAQTPNTTTSYNASPQTPPYPARPGASPLQSGAVISLAPQDVTLDVANPAAGQTVHITAQLHNGSVYQDVSGLTVQLVDASNPALPQASQSGVVVPRSGVLPVQLTWTAVQPSGAPSTLLVQVLDVNGAQVASAGVPTITVANAYGGANPGTANPAPYSSNSALQTGAAQSGQSFASGNATGNADATVNPSNPGSPTAQGQQGQGSASSNAQLGASLPAVQPQIVYFGPAATIGQYSSLSLQVTNPAATLMSSLQAQLYVDGMPGPAQTLGPLLPRQTQSVTFDSATLAGGNHNIKVVVTTADGANASATASLAASQAWSRGTDVNKLRAIGVRESGSANQTGNLSTAAVATRSPAPATRPIPQGSTGANQGGARATVLPSPDSSQTVGVRSLLPQGSVAANQTRRVTTASTAGGTSPGLPPRTVVPPAPSTASQPTNVATALPPRSNPGTGTTTAAVSPGSPTTSTGTATTVLPSGRGRPGQPAGATANSVPARPYLDLSVAAAEIGFRRVAPGQSTTFTAVIHNLGTLGAKGASVVFKLNADGRITSSRPSVFNIPAGGSFQASWTAFMPAGQSVQLSVQVTANGDANPANNQALIRVR